MSLTSRDTNVANSSSLAHRIQPFDGIACESNNDQHYKQQKKYVQGYFIKAMVCMLTSYIICFICLILQRQNLLSIINANNAIIVNSVNINSKNINRQDSGIKSAFKNIKKNSEMINAMNLTSKILEKLLVQGK